MRLVNRQKDTRPTLRTTWRVCKKQSGFPRQPAPGDNFRPKARTRGRPAPFSTRIAIPHSLPAQARELTEYSREPATLSS